MPRVAFFFFANYCTCNIMTTRRCGSGYLDVVALHVCEVCYVYEGYMGSSVVFDY